MKILPILLTLSALGQAHSVSSVHLTVDQQTFSMPTGDFPNGTHFSMAFFQDGVGHHSVIPPANVIGLFTPGGNPNSCSLQDYVWLRKQWVAVDAGVINLRHDCHFDTSPPHHSHAPKKRVKVVKAKKVDWTKFQSSEEPHQAAPKPIVLPTQSGGDPNLRCGLFAQEWCPKETK